MTSFLFYILSGVLLSSAIMVVTTKNTVYGVLFLILAFFNAAGLFILAHAEFLAMVLLVVYVGAIAVLFLFVVMMINVEARQVQPFDCNYLLMGTFVGFVLTVELVLVFMSWNTSPEAFELIFAPQDGFSNTRALGALLYTHYALIFQAAGLILLIAMIGAIVLTLRQREGVLKQKIADQLVRQAKDSVQLVDISAASSLQNSEPLNEERINSVP